MKRRDFISLLGVAAAWPLAARAQQPVKLWRVGFLAGSRPISCLKRLRRFLRGMSELGYVEGTDFVVECACRGEI